MGKGWGGKGSREICAIQKYLIPELGGVGVGAATVRLLQRSR